METMTRGTAKITLPADDQILITREFAAPKDLVYTAYTTPELVARWWHAERGKVLSIDIDLRVGGRWRYAMTAEAGFEVAFHGEFREIVPDERIVSTEVFEGMPDAAALDTVTFLEKDGKTTLSILVQHRNQANRDAHLQAGMEAGLQTALDLLENLTVGDDDTSSDV